MKLSKIAKIISLNVLLITSFNSFSAPTTYDSTWGSNMEGKVDGLSNDAWDTFELDKKQTTDITQAQTDANNALINAATADKHAGQAQTDATNALTNAATANQSASQAQKMANTADIEAKNSYSVGIYAKTQALQAEQHTIDNENSIRNVQSRVNQQSKTLANHEDRITSLENQENTNFSNLKNEVDNNRRRSSTGIAEVSAMANIPQVTEGQKFAVGVGVGTFDSENSLAIGTSVRINEHIVAKTSVSEGSYGGATFGVGVSFGF